VVFFFVFHAFRINTYVHLGAGVPKLWGVPPRGHELNEIWAKDKVYIGRTLLGWNMKLALFYDSNFTKVYINLEKYVIH
jgi:hypothetical protein